MLEIIIQKYLENYESTEEVVDNEEIQALENKCAELLDKLKELDKEFGNETDYLVGEMIVEYRNLFFEKGFKYGLTLGLEIQQALIKNQKLL